MQRKLSYAALLPILGFGLTVAAHATPITAGTYNLADTTISDGTHTYDFAGYVTIGSNGLLTGASITLEDSAIGDPVFNVVTGPGSGGYDPVADFATITTTGNTAQMYFSYLPTLDGSGDIDLCILSANNCNNYQASYSHIDGLTSFGYNNVDLTGGVLAAPTPEPASLLLLGTGIAGLAAMGRRRFMKI